MGDDPPRGPSARWSQPTAPFHSRTPVTGDAPARAETIGRFILLDQLGAGGMGIVYSAYDPLLDRKVALKLLHADEQSELGTVRTRLLREAQAMARLDHPNVIAVHDVGVERDHVYIAMELAEGGTLRHWLEQRRRGLREVIAMFVQAGRGLAAAHAAGLVHRDFKPDNVLITRSGTPRVTDFGLVSADSTPAPATEPEADKVIAARGSALSISLTRTGTAMGTPAYMAPEQFQGGVTTARTDQFAFCVALHEAIYGERPFAGTTFDEVADNVMAGKLVIPDVPDVPVRLRRLISRGLAADGAARWPSMEALLAELAPPPRRRVWPFALALVVAAGGVGAFMLARDPSPSCGQLASDRAATAWTPKAHADIRSRFLATGRSFAERAAQTVDAGLDAYAGHWVQLVSDTCLAERAATASAREPLARKQACFDHRLAALRALVATLSTDVSPELVSHADEIDRALPDLADCAEDPTERPRDRNAAAIAKLVVDLGSARLHAIAGDFTRAATEAAAIAVGADAIGWAPLQVQAHTLVGNVQLSLSKPARKELLGAAEIAFEHGLDRDAARALALAVTSAGHESSSDGISTLAPLVRAAAGRTHDRALEIGAEIAIARGMAQVHQWQGALALCQKAHEDAQQLHDRDVLADADDCLLECLAPLARYSEIGSLIARRMDELKAQCGDDCPALASYLEIASDVSRREGKLADARAQAERSLAIRTNAFGPRHYEVARSLAYLADVAAAENKSDEARRLREQALELCDETHRFELPTIVQVHTDLAVELANEQHLPEASEHFEKALELMRLRSGDDAVGYAILLANYGQVKADIDLAAGLVMLQHAEEILERHHDKRLLGVRTMMMVVADHHDHFADEIRYGDQVLALVDADTPPEQVALIEHGMMRAIGLSHGDLARGRKLAADARAIYLKLGPKYATEVEVIDDWLAKH